MSSVDECKLVNLEKIEMREGNLSPLYGGVDVPFEIKRVFYLYDVPGGAERGGHAHRVLEQFIVAASGAFEVMLDDGQNRRTVSLDRSYYGLYVPSMIWTQVTGFCTGAICSGVRLAGLRGVGLHPRLSGVLGCGPAKCGRAGDRLFGPTIKAETDRLVDSGRSI